MGEDSQNPTSEIQIPKSPWLIVGLGNPGEEYADTYHNVGFRVLDRMAQAQGKHINIRCGPALISAKILLAGQPAVLVAPQTYMNNSGAALPPVFERFEAGPKHLIVIYDDVDLPIGRIRLRQKGSAGGHNGIKSLISTLGGDEFLRIRVGIQPERPRDNVRDFVLSRVAKSDWDLLIQAEEVAGKAVETLVADGIEKAMAAYNGIDLRREEEKDS
jgi:PTH1 family peptidyl-tRNA hydrolase